jgi:hypothetical protein
MGGENSRAAFKAPIAVEDVLNSRMIAYPFRLFAEAGITHSLPRRGADQPIYSAPCKARRYATAAAAPQGLSDVIPPARPETVALKSCQALVPPVSAV